MRTYGRSGETFESIYIETLQFDIELLQFERRLLQQGDASSSGAQPPPDQQQPAPLSSLSSTGKRGRASRRNAEAESTRLADTRALARFIRDRVRDEPLKYFMDIRILQCDEGAYWRLGNLGTFRADAAELLRRIVLPWRARCAGKLGPADLGADGWPRPPNSFDLASPGVGGTPVLGLLSGGQDARDQACIVPVRACLRVGRGAHVSLALDALTLPIYPPAAFAVPGPDGIAPAPPGTGPAAEDQTVDALDVDAFAPGADDDDEGEDYELR